MKWFMERLITMVAIWSILGMSQAALAQAPKLPACPPNCGNGGGGNYTHMQVYNVGSTNTVLKYTKPTQAQMKYAAAQIELYVSQQVATGNIGAMQAEFLALLNNNTWGSMYFDGTKGQQLSASFGGIMTLQQLQADLNNVSASDRQTIASYIKTYGLADFMDSGAQLLNEMGGEYIRGKQHSKHWLSIVDRYRHVYTKLGYEPPVDVPRAWLDGCAAVGTALMIFGGPVGGAVGGGLLIGSALGFLYLDIFQ
jgi:hypothetical protein